MATRGQLLAAVGGAAFMALGTIGTVPVQAAFDYSSPQNSGPNVVWQGFDVNEEQEELFFYDGRTTTQLTNNSSNNFINQFRISGSNVVWESNEIFLYNGTTTTQLTNGSFDEAYPDISGSNVVWQGFDGSDSEIFFYDGTTTTQLTNNSTADSSPQISGSNVVWDRDSEIFLYDGTTTTQLTNGVYDVSRPLISGSNVVWEGYDGNDSEIFLYDGTTTTQLTNNSLNDFNPQISGSNVVWRNYDGNDDEIFLYDGTTTQLTNNSIDDLNFDISGSNVVWYNFDGNDGEIFLNDGNTTTQLTNNSITDRDPQISGSNVVWEGNSEIFLYDGTTTTRLTNNGGVVPPPETVRANFSATLDRVEVNVPGVTVGTPVSGSISYNKIPLVDPEYGGTYSAIDFTLTVDSFNFDIEDVLVSTIAEYAGTRGFGAQVSLQGGEGLGDWSNGFSLEIFQEFGDSNLFLSGAAAIGGLNLTFEKVTPVPEPSATLGLLVFAALCVGSALKRQLQNKQELPSCRQHKSRKELRSHSAAKIYL